MPDIPIDDREYPWMPGNTHGCQISLWMPG